jgi:hypothetical protein
VLFGLGYCFPSNNSGRGAKTIVAHGVVEGMVGEGYFFFCFFFFIKCKKYIDKKIARQACVTSWKPAVHKE